jgi:hypothetical protein
MVSSTFAYRLLQETNMPRTRKPAPSRGGSDTAKRLGLKPLLVWLTPEEHLQIRSAAGAAGLPMSHFVKSVALRAADAMPAPRDR